MFRTISLVETTEGADIDAIVRAGTRMVEEDPNVAWGQVTGGLQLMKRTHPEAGYAMILDFEDLEAWRRYGAGEPHASFGALVADIVVRITLTEYFYEP